MLNRRAILVFLWLTTIEGIILFLLSFATPSEAGNAWLWGYSAPRLIVLAWTSGCVVFVFGFTVQSSRNPQWIERKTGKLRAFLSSARNLLTTSVLLWSGLIISGSLILITFSFFGNDLGVLPVILERIKFLLLWGFLFFLQATVLLALYYKNAYLHKGFWNTVILGRLFIVAVVLGASVFHWIILLIQLQVYTRLPGWFFFFHPRSYEGREWLFLFLLAGSLLLIFYFTTRIRGWRGVYLLMIWGYVLQMGFMWMDWGSLERMSDKYIVRYAPYANAISTAPAPLELIRNYQELYSKNIYTGTKAPGFMLSYWVSQKLATWNLPQPSPDQKTERLSVFITLLYPALATLVLIPLYLLSKSLLELKQRNMPLLLYLSFPGVLLISLFLDQVLYPFLFVLMIWLAIILVEKGNFWLAIGLGCLLYLALFMAFALLPAIFMVFMLVGLHSFLFKQGWPAIKRSITLVLGLLAGFMIVYLIFATLLGYDALARYFQAMESHRLAKQYSVELASLPLTILINNLDFGLGAGFPTLFLLLILAARSIYTLLGGHRQITRLDWVTLSFMGMFLVLNIAGQTRSETARLWIFLLPLSAIFITNFLDKLFAKHSWWLYGWVTLQLLSTFLIFKFQWFY